MPEPKMQDVFVYGSLKKGNKNRGMQHFPNAVFKGIARTKRALFRMIDLGAFPGVLIAEDDGSEYIEQGYQIAGEVYSVNREDLDSLDQIEGVPFFYDRQQINTTLGTVHMYILPNTGEYDGHPTHEQRQEVVFDQTSQDGKTKEITIPASKNIQLQASSRQGSGGVLTWTG